MNRLLICSDPYLDFLDRHDDNFIRLRASYSAVWNTGVNGSRVVTGKRHLRRCHFVRRLGIDVHNWRAGAGASGSEEMISGYWAWPYRFARYREIIDLWFLPENEK